jgi:polyhydroxyalkanoate synthesis regulator phasin
MYLIASSAFAKTDTVSCEYKYVLGDNDTKHDARKIAFIEAKRRCAEQIGMLLASETVITSSDLTKDEIRAYSLSFMKTEQVAESFLPSGDGLAVLVKLNAQYDSDLMNTRLKELLSDRGRSQEFKKAQEQILALEQQVVSLQRQLSQPIPDEQIIRLREERNMALSQYETIFRNLETLNTKTRQYARCGMTMEEVRSVLGAPRTTKNVFSGRESWNYGEKWLLFEQRVIIAILTNESSGFPGTGCNTK